MNSPKGFILIEFLVATTLFSLAGSGLYTGFLQGIKAHQKIEESFQTYDPFRILFLRLEEDLRNTVTLKDYPFKGQSEEIEFPLLLTEEKAKGEKEKKLLIVRYFLKDQDLIRTEEELTHKLVKEKPKQRLLFKNIKSLEFRFPYEDQEEKRTFESFWLEEPYQGIPRGVRINLQTPKAALTKTVSLPQGKIGHLEGKTP